jgi:hypothetical protein
MFGNFKIADIIAFHCARIDTICRQELQRGVLVSERDYVTALSTRIRDELRIHFHIPCHSQTVRPRTETENGVDGIIVFKYHDEVKAGLFEAKRPQIYNAHRPSTINNYAWDTLTDKNTSHFSEQIQKQHKWVGALGLWEMFFNDGPAGFGSPPFDFFGSSCVWHDNAYNFMNIQGLIFNRWTTADLQFLLTSNCVNFYSIIYDLLSCKAGRRFKVDAKNQSATIFSPANDNFLMDIPLPIKVTNKKDDRVEAFLLKNDLDNFTFLNLDNIEKRYH